MFSGFGPSTPAETPTPTLGWGAATNATTTASTTASLTGSFTFGSPTSPSPPGPQSAFGGAFGGGPPSAFGGGPPSAFGGGPPSAFGGGPPSTFGGPRPAFGSTFGDPPPFGSGPGRRGGFHGASSRGAPTSFAVTPPSSAPSGFGSFGGAAMNAPRPLSAFRQLTTTFTDTISSIAWNGQPEATQLLAVASWDGTINLLKESGGADLTIFKAHSAPILDVVFNSNDSELITAGADCTVQRTILATQTTTPFLNSSSSHQMPVKCLALGPNGSVFSAGFDKLLCTWDSASGRLVSSHQLPERAYAMASLENWLVVGCAERHIRIFDVRSMDRPFRDMLSPLKFMTRAVAIAPNKTWFAVTGVDGRCSVVHFEESSSGRDDFTFKCHRRSDDVFVVNDVAFHPNGIFVTCGNDCTVSLWDKESRSRLRELKPPSDIVGLVRARFNASGTQLAVAAAYDWSMGPGNYNPSAPGTVYIVTPGHVERRSTPSRR